MSRRKKKRSFKDTWATLTEIGKLFNVSAVRVGAQLKVLGFREADGKPTTKALELLLAHEGVRAGGFAFYLWDRQRISDRLRGAGWKQLAGAFDREFHTAQEAVRLCKKGEELMEKGQDKLSQFAFDAAHSEIALLVSQAKVDDRTPRALRIARYLKQLKLPPDEIRVLVGEGRIDWNTVDLDGGEPT